MRHNILIWVMCPYNLLSWCCPRSKIQSFIFLFLILVLNHMIFGTEGNTIVWLTTLLFINCTHQSLSVYSSLRYVVLSVVLCLVLRSSNLMWCVTCLAIRAEWVHKLLTCWAFRTLHFFVSNINNSWRIMTLVYSK